jgi:integrase
MGRRLDGLPHRSPKQGSIWLEKRGDTLVWRGRQTEKGKPTVRASVTVPRGLTGTRLEAASKKARQDCETQLKRRIAERDRDEMLPADRERATLADYADLWLTAAEHSERRDSTVVVHRSRWENHIKSHLGPVKLRDLRKEHVVRWWEKVPTDAARFHAHTTLMAILHQAADDEYPVAASVLRVDRPGYVVPDQPHMTGAQVRKLVDASAEPWRTVWLVFWTTTARVSEVLGFVWADLDEVNGALVLAKQLERGTNERVDLKARRQRRRVSLGGECLAALKEHRKRETAAGRGMPGDFLFCRDDGQPVYYRLVRDAFKAALTDAKLPDSLKLHSLRHGAAQALIDSGLDLDTVSRRLGHATVGTTSESYLRQSVIGDAEAARRLEAAIGRH